MMRILACLIQLALLGPAATFAQQRGDVAGDESAVAWPDGKHMALSLSFDDGRASQVETGVPLFAKYGARVTFYVTPGGVEERLEGWKRAVADGHEIGNHTLNHPCTGNFPWARDKALENYTLEQMEAELLAANAQVAGLLGVTPVSFAYPCGQTFVGRGVATASFVPLVAEHFTSGRGWLDEAPNDPAFVDLAQVLGVEMDGNSFDELLPMIEPARERGAWLVLAGHDIGESGRQTTRTAMLEALIAYAQNPAHGIWLAPVGEVAAWIKAQREP